MRIAVLTLPLHTNYGGILQAYALQTVLKRMGHEVWLIDSPPRRIETQLYEYPFLFIKRLYQKFFLKWNIKIFPEFSRNILYPIVTSRIRIFISEQIKKIDVYDFGTIDKSDFDAIIVGSDQIWRPAYYPNIENAFLSFAKDWNIKRIAYAVSFGTDSWEFSKFETDRCMNLIKQFDFVSVREDMGVFFCEKYFDVKATHVVDPTLLLNESDYSFLISKFNLKKKCKGVLVYILDNTREKQEIVSYWSNRLNLPLFKVDKIGVKSPFLYKRIHPSVEEWLYGFKNASYVVTDSFHGCVFSVIFKKPFVVIENENRGNSRLISLLKLLQLEHRLVRNLNDNYCIEEKIDYKRVYNLLNVFVEKSQNLLNNALK